MFDPPCRSVFVIIPAPPGISLKSLPRNEPNAYSWQPLTRHYELVPEKIMTPTKKIITRFAPSPTGFLHIGGGRTALFNWLFARRHGGDFKLRIEDTDRERSTDAAISAIFEGLKWLGLEWDGEPVF